MVTTRSMEKAKSNSGQKTKSNSGQKTKSNSGQKTKSNSGQKTKSNSGRKTKRRQQTQTPNVAFFKARDIVMSSFPECLTNEQHHVRSSAIHRLKYARELVHWVDFQEDVRRTFDSISWDDYQRPLDVKFHETTGNENVLREEHFMSGNELSTNSRYVQHVLHVMSAIAKEIGIGVFFGDWDATDARQASKKAKEEAEGKGKKGGKKGGGKGKGEAQSAESSKAQKSESTEVNKDMDLQPDFALMDSEFVPRAVGEGKTPFSQHQFSRDVSDAIDGRDDSLLRNILGQPARYMRAFDLKYGFIMNYKDTIFLRQEFVAGSWKLMYSDVIPHDQVSTIEPVKVSVREAMLFLQAVAAGDKTDWTSYNTTPPEEWVKDLKPGKKRKRDSKVVGGDRGEAEGEERNSHNDEDAGNDEPGPSRKKKRVSFE
ncbi:hypothetical protein DTO164E3_1311 [Paecilomyces variotii]|nr:hypothetical protein DTO164E3_1311 [Paecilomyces variotii]KAJ9224466.1 hypothetical protein DTO169C6_3297 [Paecilomyces variotii]KAJ9254869.1 hypothetical protein DTO207G8_3399 [Paecilomyces variotii]KAJ9280129.1 hypothetical protein DTO021D3_3046 [Paecilomyces variotii]KAJ9323785.1 hypothetical protein DTO027B3_5134 [Paecilomyces variotii]